MIAKIIILFIKNLSPFPVLFLQSPNYQQELKQFFAVKEMVYVYLLILIPNG